mmetsp:Transcript_17284/g.56177  ORF Transcript_17284/g.56177 Transcript_17284/m.56177 type:complete len:212 (+) Transcript_17284:949-1584(+)
MAVLAPRHWEQTTKLRAKARRTPVRTSRRWRRRHLMRRPFPATLAWMPYSLARNDTTIAGSRPRARQTASKFVHTTAAPPSRSNSRGGIFTRCSPRSDSSRAAASSKDRSRTTSKSQNHGSSLEEEEEEESPSTALVVVSACPSAASPMTTSKRSPSTTLAVATIARVPLSSFFSKATRAPTSTHKGALRLTSTFPFFSLDTFAAQLDGPA